jgi:hypothetical protein
VRSPEYLARIDRDRPGLAHRLGDELGSAFEIEFDVPQSVGRGPRRTSYRSEREPTNPAAAAAFGAIADAHREQREFWQQQAEAMRASGRADVKAGWYAVSPQSGRMFIPPEADDLPGGPHAR